MNFEEQLYKLNEIGIALCQERNIEVLLEKILSEACAFTGAEGGSLYIREKNELCFKVSQNEKLPQNLQLRGLRIPLSNSSVAGYVAMTGEILNIEDVYELPQSAPYRVDLSFDKKNNYRTRSMLLVPMQKSGHEPLGVLALINAVSPEGDLISFDYRYESLVHSLASQAAVAVSNAQLHQELKDAYLDTIFRLSRAAECRDADTAFHLERISAYSSILAKTLGFPAKFIEDICYASPMHDVGKIGVPDNILLKPGKLTDAEYEAMKQHTLYGSKILSEGKSDIIKLSEEIALTHHEKYDGTGYPRKMAGDKIPWSGRIVALADVFDALVSKRCYKKAWSVESVIKFVDEQSGKHFDPKVVEAFHKSLPKILEAKELYSAK